MPDFVPEALKKEVEVGGRKIPLWVPAIGGILAVGVFALVKLTGKGKAGGTSAQAEAAATAAATTSYASTLTEKVGEAQAGFSEQIGTLQANVAEQIAKAQEQFGGQVAGVQASQAALTGLVTGYQAQMTEQTGALQAGIAGVQTAQTAFKSDVNARIGAVEGRMSDLERKGSKLAPGDRAAIINMGVGLGTPLTTLWRKVAPGGESLPYPTAGPYSFQWGPTTVEFPQ